VGLVAYLIETTTTSSVSARCWPEDTETCDVPTRNAAGRRNPAS
jgi:hypothetical protein